MSNQCDNFSVSEESNYITPSASSSHRSSMIPDDTDATCKVALSNHDKSIKVNLPNGEQIWVQPQPDKNTINELLRDELKNLNIPVTRCIFYLGGPTQARPTSQNLLKQNTDLSQLVCNEITVQPIGNRKLFNSDEAIVSCEKRHIIVPMVATGLAKWARLFSFTSLLCCVCDQKLCFNTGLKCSQCNQTLHNACSSEMEKTPCQAAVIAARQDSDLNVSTSKPDSTLSNVNENQQKTPDRSPFKSSGYKKHFSISDPQQPRAVCIRFEKGQMVISHVSMSMNTENVHIVKTPCGHVVLIQNQAAFEQPPDVGTSPAPQELKISLDTLAVSQHASLSHRSTFNVENSRELVLYIKKNADNVRCLNRIGSGTFSDVYRADFEGTAVAVKKLKTFPSARNDCSTLSSTQQSAFANELRMLKRLRHPNLILLRGFYMEPELAIITEFCGGKTLYTILHQDTTQLSGTEVERISDEIVLGMHHLHTLNIVHGDLKSKNIFLTKHDEVKIGDMGLSTVREALLGCKSGRGGTLEWMAPELINEALLTEEDQSDPDTITKSDVYSFGIVLYELGSGQLPYANLEAAAIMFQVGNGRLTPDLSNLRCACVSDTMHAKICACLKVRPKDRPSFQKLLKQKLYFDVQQDQIGVKALAKRYNELAQRSRN